MTFEVRYKRNTSSSYLFSEWSEWFPLVPFFELDTIAALHKLFEIFDEEKVTISGNPKRQFRRIQELSQ